MDFFNELFPEIISAIIGVIGVIITIIVGVNQFHHTKWCENISKSRMEWIKSYREDFAIVCAWVEEKLINNNQTISNEVLKAKYRMISKLNTNSVVGNECNFFLKDSLLSINNQTNKTNFDFNKFISLSNLLLEKEWQKVKKEARKYEGE